jgi:hypothetical protein
MRRPQPAALPTRSLKLRQRSSPEGDSVTSSFRHGRDGSGRPALTTPHVSTRPRRAAMQNSSAFQYLAIDTIHESTTNPAALSMKANCRSWQRVLSITGSSSPSPCAQIPKASN